MDVVQMLGARIGQLEIDKAVLYSQNIALQKELEAVRNGNNISKPDSERKEQASTSEE